MPVRESLPAVLRGESAADLSPSSREQLEALAHDAQTEKRLASVRDELGSRLKQADASWGVYYLLAAVCALNGEVERAQQTLLALGEKVAAAKAWEPLAAVAERSLALVQTQAAARFLVQAHEGLGKDPDRIDALSRAWAIMPDDLELALLLAKRLGDAKQGDSRRALLAELAPRFAAEGRWKGLEEAALEFVEHDDWEGLQHVAEALPTVASQAAFKEARALADIVVEGLAKSGRAGLALEPLRKVVATAAGAQGADAASPFRAAVAQALLQGPGARLPDAAGIVAQSGIEDDEKPLPTAIETFDTIAALPPGAGVLHDGFGPGRILTNDTEQLTLDFAKSKGHKMPYVAAKRTLTVVADDDIRLMRFTQPAEVTRMKNEDHASLIVKALQVLGGSADAQRLKLFVIASDLVPAKEWTVFWRKAKPACEKDPRIDHSRAFEQHYRLTPEVAPRTAAEEADDTPPAPVKVPLPPLEIRKAVKSNLNTIKKFLAQHPQAEDALKGRFGRYVLRAMEDVEGDRADRARCGLYVARWYPERMEQWIGVVRELWEQGIAISDLPTEDEQQQLLDYSRQAGVQAEAILSALDSRFSAVREAAEKDRALLDDAGKAQLRRAMIDRAVQYPAAVLRMIEDDFAAAVSPPDSWRLFIAALQLIEERPKPSVGEKILKWLDEGGAFEKMLASVPYTEEMRLKLRVLLRQWRSSDRYLFPALEAVARVGLAEERAWVLDHRQKKTDKLFSQVGEQVEDFDVPVMTRATYDKLKSELERLEHELRHVIPHTIQKARELGDLRENAEYHSAKLKQANVSKQVAALQLRLGRARFVEDASVQDGVVGLGTEVVLESDDEMTTYWILGEGEQHLGEHVVSFQAPIGKTLVGKGIGDEVSLGEVPKRYRIVSVERKLPPSPTTA